MLDSLLLDKDGTSPLDAAGTTYGPWRDIGGAEMIEYGVSVPVAPTGTNPTLDVSFEFSDNQSAVRETATMPQITSGPEFYFTRVANRGRRYVRAKFVVGGTTPNFGNVVAGIARGLPTINRAG